MKVGILATPHNDPRTTDRLDSLRCDLHQRKLGTLGAPNDRSIIEIEVAPDRAEEVRQLAYTNQLEVAN
jgi:hypothetical protein